jgi:uncharacterized protein YraI
MSVGGKVCEVIDTGKRIWVNTREWEGSSQSCAIYVERTAEARTISVGDTVWWQGEYARWTPKNRSGNSIGPSDIKIPRIGFSGVSRPNEETAP